MCLDVVSIHETWKCTFQAIFSRSEVASASIMIWSQEALILQTHFMGLSFPMISNQIASWSRYMCKLYMFKLHSSEISTPISTFIPTPMYVVILMILQILLEQGADPRIHADDGAVPQQVSKA